MSTEDVIVEMLKKVVSDVSYENDDVEDWTIYKDVISTLVDDGFMLPPSYFTFTESDLKQAFAMFNLVIGGNEDIEEMFSTDEKIGIFYEMLANYLGPNIPRVIPGNQQSRDIARDFFINLREGFINELIELNPELAIGSPSISGISDISAIQAGPQQTGGSCSADVANLRGCDGDEVCNVSDSKCYDSLDHIEVIDGKKYGAIDKAALDAFKKRLAEHKQSLIVRKDEKGTNVIIPPIAGVPQKVLFTPEFIQSVQSANSLATLVSFAREAGIANFNGTAWSKVRADSKELVRQLILSKASINVATKEEMCDINAKSMKDFKGCPAPKLCDVESGKCVDANQQRSGTVSDVVAGYKVFGSISAVNAFKSKMGILPVATPVVQQAVAPPLVLPQPVVRPASPPRAAVRPASIRARCAVDDPDEFKGCPPGYTCDVDSNDCVRGDGQLVDVHGGRSYSVRGSPANIESFKQKFVPRPVVAAPIAPIQVPQVAAGSHREVNGVSKAEVLNVSGITKLKPLLSKLGITGYSKATSADFEKWKALALAKFESVGLPVLTGPPRAVVRPASPPAQATVRLPVVRPASPPAQATVRLPVVRPASPPKPASVRGLPVADVRPLNDSPAARQEEDLKARIRKCVGLVAQ